MSFDVIVVGLGAAGSAAAHQLARRGLSVLGLDRHAVPNDRGSSHGRSRVIRTAYYEDPAYVPLLRRAWALWEALETNAGEALLTKTGALNIGTPDHAAIRGVLDAARLHGLAHEVLTGNELARRHPVISPGPDDIAVFERDAGILAPERCVAAAAGAARRAGADLRGDTPALAIDAAGDGFAVHTRDRVFRAPRLVLSAGAWLADTALTFGSALPLTVERQVQLWFRADAASRMSPAELPVFIQFTERGVFYGLPDVGDGVKVCRHHGGEKTTADALDRSLRPRDVADVRSFLARHLPSLDGEPLDARICMYSNTPDDHFLIGPHPEHPSALVLGGFSGHGFKLAPVVGEIAADLISDGETQHPIALFDPARFR